MTLSRTLSRKWRSFLSYGWQERLLLIPVLCLLALSRALIISLAFKRYVWIFGKAGDTGVVNLSERQLSRARAIGKTIRMAAKITPWQSVCLPQAMTACLLLRLYRIPFKVHFGVMPNESQEFQDPFLAHVWVTAGTCFPTGGFGHEKHTVVASFQHP